MPSQGSSRSGPNWRDPSQALARAAPGGAWRPGPSHGAAAGGEGGAAACGSPCLWRLGLCGVTPALSSRRCWPSQLGPLRTRGQVGGRPHLPPGERRGPEAGGVPSLPVRGERPLLQRRPAAGLAPRRVPGPSVKLGLRPPAPPLPALPPCQLPPRGRVRPGWRAAGPWPPQPTLRGRACSRPGRLASCPQPPRQGPADHSGQGPPREAHGVGVGAAPPREAGVGARGPRGHGGAAAWRAPLRAGWPSGRFLGSEAAECQPPGRGLGTLGNGHPPLSSWGTRPRVGAPWARGGVWQPGRALRTVTPCPGAFRPHAPRPQRLSGVGDGEGRGEGSRLLARGHAL